MTELKECIYWTINGRQAGKLTEQIKHIVESFGPNLNIKVTSSDIEKLEKKLEVAEAALEFYANPDTKNIEINNFIEPEMLNCELGTFIKEDFECMVGNECYGDKRYGTFQGKIAREALTKIKE